MSVSIKDIAEATNYSYSTVSRALNNSPRVKPETREEIQRVAAKMGYLPSAIARSLVTRRTNTIGVVVTTMTDLFYAEVIHAIEETGLSYGYRVILANSGADPHRELAAIQALRERRVDGLILVGPCSAKDGLLAQQKIDVPLVIVGSIQKSNLPDVSYVVETDNTVAGQAATAHLLDLGHKRIAYIAGPSRELDSEERRAGYSRALQARGLTEDSTLIVRGGNRPEEGMQAMRQLLKLPAPPTAVFCYNDAIALGAMQAADEAGLRIPEDLSIVGFDDIDLAVFFTPSLTTVAQPKQEMGKQAVKMIKELLTDDNGNEVEDCVLPSRLIVRKSTRAVS